MRFGCALAFAMMIASAPARADSAPKRTTVIAPVPEEPVDEPASKPEVSTKRRAAAIAVAIFPGVIAHGGGAYLVGEKRAAKRIAMSEGIGLGVAALSGLLVGGSGGNPYTVWAIPLVVGGAGLYLQSWFTDIYVAAGGKVIAAMPRAPAPWSVEVGTSWLHDAYRERALLRGGGRVSLGALGDRDGALGRVELGGNALVDAAGDAEILQGDVRVRILGAAPSGERIEDGSRVTARVGYRFHRDAPDRVNQHTTEIEANGRLDLDRIDRAFGKSFVDAGVGFGLVRVRYGDVAHEWSSDLLASFGWGVYLGDRGEVKLFYEHTRDGLVGGLPAWRASGFVGSVGGALDLRVHGPWAMHAELDIGNAFLTTFAVSYRGGPQ